MNGIEHALSKLNTPQHAHKQQPLDPKDPLTKEAQQLVAQTFYGTLMKQARNSPFKSDLFDGGRGGEAFGSMLDQHLADHMSRSTGSKLVHSLVNKLSANKAYQQQAKSKHKQPSPIALSSLVRGAMLHHPGFSGAQGPID
jgi:Rod binding domain-containing protein